MFALFQACPPFASYICMFDIRLVLILAVNSICDNQNSSLRLTLNHSPTNIMLCRACREYVFNAHSMGCLEAACGGEKRRGLVQHIRDQEPYYFWAAQKYHSGFPRTFACSFRSIQEEAEAGCMFCSLLVTATRNGPPMLLGHCFFQGPTAAFPDIIGRSEELRRHFSEAAERGQNYLDRLGPNWAQNYTWADRMQGFIENGYPKEYLLNSIKVIAEEVVPRSIDDRDKDDPAFAFTLLFNEPWDFSTVVWPYHGDGPGSGVEFSKHYFRMYLTEPRNDWRGLASSTEESVLRQVEAIREQFGIHPLPLQALARDGQIFQTLMDDCIAHHAPCTQRMTVELPSRLLVVSGTIESPLLKLIDVTNIQTSHLRYACLSYCWGGPQPGMTTTARLPEYLFKIDFAEVPKTVQDAARVTLSVGLEFLWIDAYCIVQDSGDDKVAELQKMSSIYRGAFCTIAAMSSNSSTEGFLEIDEGIAADPKTLYFDIESTVIQAEFGRNSPRCGILEMRKDFTQAALQLENLLSRAWTLQEAMLSPRLLMFFSDGQRPALRCANRIVRPDGAIIPYVPMELGTMDFINIQGTEGTRADMHGPSYQWQEIVQEYSKRSVTNPTDRLPALMGIVTEVETRMNLGDYIAGMWSQTLKRDLLWRVVGRDPIFHALQESGPRAAHQVYIGPSWSWVSRNHPVYYGNLFDEEDSSIVSYSVVPVDSLLSNGALESARLTVSCFALEVEVADDWADGEHGFFFDDKPRQLGMDKMLLLRIGSEEPYNNSHGVGLGVVEVTGTSTNTERLYRRVGMFQRGAGHKHEKQEWTRGVFTII